MAPVVAPPPTRLSSDVVAAVVAALGLLGIVAELVPSLSRLLAPTSDTYCTAIMPPFKECAPGLHLWVVGGAAVVLLLTFAAAKAALRRSDDLITRAVVVAGLALVALLAWSAARVPGPTFSLLGSF